MYCHTGQVRGHMKTSESSKSSNPIEIVCVGQTPPPYHGQAVIIASLLKGTYHSIRLHHVPLAFSRTINEVGRFQPHKVVHLVRVIGQIWYKRFRYNARMLYYPPASPYLAPVVRDIIILLLTRFLFRVTVFHFHACGLGIFISKLPAPLRLLARAIYNQPDLVIRNSRSTIDDGRLLNAHSERIILPGLADSVPEGIPPRSSLQGRSARLLFVGTLMPMKGVLVLLDAIYRLVNKGYDVITDLVGAPISSDFEKLLHAEIARTGLKDRVQLHGVLTGSAKDRAYRNADIFCFPTFHETETLGIVAIEAMQYGLPIVATQWRGLVDLVIPHVNGLLVPPRDPLALSDAIATLLDDPETMQRMGAASRAIYLERFTLERYHADIETALASVWNMTQAVAR